MNEWMLTERNKNMIMYILNHVFASSSMSFFGVSDKYNNILEKAESLLRHLSDCQLALSP